MNNINQLKKEKAELQERLKEIKEIEKTYGYDSGTKDYFGHIRICGNDGNHMFKKYVVSVDVYEKEEREYNISSKQKYKRKNNWQAILYAKTKEEIKDRLLEIRNDIDLVISHIDAGKEMKSELALKRYLKKWEGYGESE